MAALTGDRNTASRQVSLFRDPVAAKTRIFAGAMVVLDTDGNAKPATSDVDLVARGMALKQADNRLFEAGECFVEVQSGCFGLDTDGSIDRTHIGSDVYFVDDHTVSATATGRSVAGRLVDIEGAGHGATVHVFVGVKNAY